VARKEYVGSTDKKQLEANTLIKPSNINTVVIGGKGFVADILSGNQIASMTQRVIVDQAVSSRAINKLSFNESTKPIFDDIVVDTL
jgi:hypothetical protein